MCGRGGGKPRTRSLALCTALHALNNGIGFAALHRAPALWQHAGTFRGLYPSAAHYAGAVALSAAGLAAYVRGVARSPRGASRARLVRVAHAPLAQS